MRYRLRDIPAMLRTAPGRAQIQMGISYRMWPLFAQVAGFYRRTFARRAWVVAVVGSLGKTTTRRVVTAALDLPPPRDAQGNAFGVIGRAILRLKHEPRAVIEVGIAHLGEMRRYARTLRPDVVVVTAVASEHLRSLGSLEGVREEKAWMVRVLSAQQTVILNGDDPNVLWMKGETAARIITCGFSVDCDVRAEDYQLDWPRGARFRVSVFGESFTVQSRLFGRHMVFPLLAGIAVGKLEGVPTETIVRRLAEVQPVPGRLEVVALPNNVLLLRDEFKSALESIHRALDVLADVPAARRIVLLGDIAEPPGSQRIAYREIGVRLADIATAFIAIGHGLQRYAAGARAAGMPSERIFDGGRTAQDAAAVLQRILQPGDVLLIKGRDTQKLDRIRLILNGATVRCAIRYCDLRIVECEHCAMCEPGWGEHPIIMGSNHLAS